MSPHRFGIRAIGLVAAGGAAGTVARAAVEQAAQVGPSGFPWATLVVNLGGCFLLGLVIGASERAASSGYMRLLLGTGLCGGFTTFSTLAVEGVSLIRAGRVGVAVAYAVVSVTAGLLLVIAAARLPRVWAAEEV